MAGNLLPINIFTKSSIIDLELGSKHTSGDSIIYLLSFATRRSTFDAFK